MGGRTGCRLLHPARQLVRDTERATVVDGPSLDVSLEGTLSVDGT
jgi:hypothetical protein